MMGLKDAQIVKHGLPIRPAFSKPPAKREPLRRRLGLHPTLPAVLMVGGGEGMGQLETTVREIANKGTKCQVRDRPRPGVVAAQDRKHPHHVPGTCPGVVDARDKAQGVRQGRVRRWW